MSSTPKEQQNAAPPERQTESKRLLELHLRFLKAKAKTKPTPVFCNRDPRRGKQGDASSEADSSFSSRSSSRRNSGKSPQALTPEVTSAPKRSSASWEEQLSALDALRNKLDQTSGELAGKIAEEQRIIEREERYSSAKHVERYKSFSEQLQKAKEELERIELETQRKK
jgi:hypothetical protein